MIKDYNQILPGLEQDIIKKINKLENNRLFVKRITYSSVSLVSLFGIVQYITYIFKAISVSGAFEYVTLPFYDISLITYWKELILSIAESFPFMEFGITLFIAGLFIWSIKNLQVNLTMNKLNI